MNKTVTALLGGVAALATLDAAQAAVPVAAQSADVMTVHSYADLLEPIQNASTLLISDDARRAQLPPARIQLAEHHHHHHHHHNSFFGGFFPGFVAPYAYGPDECYWTWQRHWNGRYWVRRRVRVCD